MKRSEFLKRGGAVAVLAVVAPKVLVKAATDAPVVAAADTATTLTVANGGLFRAGDILRMTSSGEAMMVTSVSDNLLTVTRGLGSVMPAPIHRGDGVVLVAGAVEEAGPWGPWKDDQLFPRVTVAA